MADTCIFIAGSFDSHPGLDVVRRSLYALVRSAFSPARPASGFFSVRPYPFASSIDGIYLPLSKFHVVVICMYSHPSLCTHLSSFLVISHLVHIFFSCPIPLLVPTQIVLLESDVYIPTQLAVPPFLSRHLICSVYKTSSLTTVPFLSQ